MTSRDVLGSLVRCGEPIAYATRSPGYGHVAAVPSIGANGSEPLPIVIKAEAYIRLRQARRPLEAPSLSFSCGMVNRSAGLLPRAQHVRPPGPPQAARAACPASWPDVDADVRRLGDGLHSWAYSSDQAYLADVPKAVHKWTLKEAVLTGLRDC